MDFLEVCRVKFESDPRPFKLGNYYCFWYNSKNEPRIVLGPDWIVAAVELIVINGLCGYFLKSMDKVEHDMLFMVGATMLFL
jgi:hypothetical protein